jgi:predicted enzyme related to lactoylglutathione lyase
MSAVVTRGSFVWHDLMTTDPQGAISFYSKVAGWGTQPWEGPTPYTMWTAGPAPIGGVMQMPEGVQAPPHWLGYVSTPSVDATVDAAKKLGASVLHQPTDIPSVGRFAVLADPQGVAFAVYSSNNPAPPSDAAPAVGEFSWHELVTTDPEAAWSFYSTLFGWEKTSAMDMGPMGVYQMFGLSKDVPFGGMFKQPAEMPGPPAWCHYVKVDDVNRAVEAAKSHGGQIINGPMEVPGGDWIAQGIDPQGGMFAVHAAARP